MTSTKLPRLVVHVDDMRAEREEVQRILGRAGKDASEWTVRSFGEGQEVVDSVTQGESWWADVSIVVLDHRLPEPFVLPDYVPPEGTLTDEGLGGVHLGDWLHKRFKSILFVMRSAQMNEGQKAYAHAHFAHFRTLDISESAGLVEAVHELWSIWAAERGTGIPAAVQGATMGQLANSDLPILLTGEAGTGKSTFARRVHYSGTRPPGSFYNHTCRNRKDASTYGDIFGRVARGRSSELGAVARAVGLRPSVATALASTYREMVIASGLADGEPAVADPEEDEEGFGQVLELRGPDGHVLKGTLLIEHVERLPQMAQAALVEFIDHGLFQPEGSVGPRYRVDVRVISASPYTRRMLRLRGLDRQLVERLSGWAIQLPNLRERGDVALVIANQWASARGLRFGNEACACLQRLIVADGWFDEPLGDDEDREGGNLRGLQRLLSRAFAIAKRSAKDSDEVLAEHIEEAKTRTFGLSEAPQDIVPVEAYELCDRARRLMESSVACTAALDAERSPEDRILYEDVEFVLYLRGIIRTQAPQLAKSVEVWASKPEIVISNLSWNQPSRRRWRWNVLLATLLIATKMAFNAKRLHMEVFVPGADGNQTSPIKDAYDYFFGGFVGPVGDRQERLPDLCFNKKAKSRSILDILDRELRGEPAEVGYSVELISAMPHAHAYWAYIKRVYQLAWERSRTTA